jgi:hypothetical protein
MHSRKANSIGKNCKPPWAGKSDAFRVLQSPTTATLVPCKEESVGFDDTENIFIYPDKFSETRDEYLSRIGDRDETGYMTREGLFRTNSKDSGHYHFNWLSMIMYKAITFTLLGVKGYIIKVSNRPCH